MGDLPVFSTGDDRITVTSTGVYVDMIGTPLDLEWGCDLRTFVHPERGRSYREAITRLLGDDGLAKVLAEVQEAMTALPPLPPDPAKGVFPADMAALVAQARSLAAVLASATAFPKVLTEVDFFGSAEESTMPMDPHEPARTTKVRAVHHVGEREIGVEATASWWNERDLASADIRVYTIDRSSDPPASWSLSLSAPWTEVLVMGRHTSAIWDTLGWNLARSHFPGMAVRRITP